MFLPFQALPDQVIFRRISNGNIHKLAGLCLGLSFSVRFFCC